MQFHLDPNFYKWNEYFTTKSTNLAAYEISYGSEKSYSLKLRVSTLNYGNCYAWELSTRDDKLQCNLSLSCTNKKIETLFLFFIEY